MVDIDDIDEKVNPRDSRYHMDGKLIDDRDECIGAVDDQDLGLLLRLLAMDKDYLDAEHAESRPANEDLHGITQTRI